MSECDEVADNLPLVNIGRRITMDEARKMVRANCPDESEQLIDNIAERWRERVNNHFDHGATRLLRAIFGGNAR